MRKAHGLKHPTKPVKKVPTAIIQRTGLTTHAYAITEPLHPPDAVTELLHAPPFQVNTTAYEDTPPAIANNVTIHSDESSLASSKNLEEYKE